MSQPEPEQKHVIQRLQPEQESPKKCEAEEAEPPAATQPQTSEPQLSQLPEAERTPHTAEEKEDVTMDTSENRPENEVPEPPVPIADQVSNDDRPEGSAEEEERKESSMPKSFKRKISVVSATKGVQAGNSDTEGASLVESVVGEPVLLPHRRNLLSVSPLSHSRASSPTSNPWRGRRLLWIFMLMTPESLRMRQSVMATMGPMTKD